MVGTHTTVELKDFEKEERGREKERKKGRERKKEKGASAGSTKLNWVGTTQFGVLPMGLPPQ